MKFKLGDIVQPIGRKAGIIVEIEFDNPNIIEYQGVKYYGNYGVADGDPDYIWYYGEKQIKKLSNGIKGNINLGNFIKNMLHEKGIKK